MEITEKKELSKEFKYFKSHYVSLNFGYENILLYPENNELNLLFYPSNQFSIITGKILNLETVFLNWCMTHPVVANIQDFIKIGKCLQKNIVKIEYNDSFFTFIFNNKEEQEEKVVFKTGIPEEVKKLLEKLNNAKTALTTSIIFPLSDEYFDGELFEVYIGENNSISPKRVHEKIIEIEKKEIKALLKNRTSSAINYSTPDSLSHRYVRISSCDNDLNLELSQYFITL